MTSTIDSVDSKYKKHELRSHIYNRPAMYIGTIEPNTIDTYIVDNSNKIIKKQITYIPGLFKIFDEALVNAIDHVTRTRNDFKSGKIDTCLVKNIKVHINKATGVIDIYNDGNGIEVVKHGEYNLWIPELIFGELLTSSNYNDDEIRTVGGVNGLGIKLTNIFSKEFTIETIDHTRKKIYKQVFKDNLTIKGTADIKSCQKKPYTKISFLPDYEKFGLKEMTDDIYDLFKRRVYDVSACTDASVNVYLNDDKIPVKDFEKYADLFLDTKNIQPRFYESPNERWEIIVALNTTGNLEQMSFVNGINTIRGGRHIDYITNAITKKMTEMALTKKKKTIRPQLIRDNLFIFVKCIIENPSFDSQSKETLTSQYNKFGSKCDLSDKFYEKLYKSGIIEIALSASEIDEKKKLTKTDGKKISKIIVPKLDDANMAGTKDSHKCTLILTEGDSAKSTAIAGLSVIGRDHYGVFPLRGKIMNVKDVTYQKISDNAEITALKKILGLEQNKDYTDNIGSLRYGSILIMTDQDHDGSHIKGLLFNVFETLWGSLYKYDGFMTSLLTPIIKATHSTSKEVISFYNMSDYEKWMESGINKGHWKIKYYKGLGTSTDEEAKEYFKNMKKITYKHTEKSNEYINLAFNKKRADDRKEWLSKYDKNDVLDYKEEIVTYESFINKDLIHFSNRNLERSIPNIMDGLKESTRKILYACFKRKLYTNEIKFITRCYYWNGSNIRRN
jgi:DNA topoisomerase-2